MKSAGLVTAVALAALLAPAPASAQLFPFSSLRSYFEAAIKDSGGPGAGAAAEDGAAAAAEPAPALLLPPPNHRPADDLTEAAPVVGLLRPAAPPSQVLLPPPAGAGPPVGYAELLAAAARARPAPATALLPPSLDASALFLSPAPAPGLLSPVSTTPTPTSTSTPTPAPAKARSGGSAYPKKYWAEGEPANHKPGKKSRYPKKETAKMSKEKVQGKQERSERLRVEATVQAAAFPAARPVAGEQVAAASSFSGVSASGGGGGDRVEFQMHGQHGPHSYKWGYDTGKGHNRQFRYEERDTLGHVKGHYGFYDKQGKLQVVSYSADPDSGYHADGTFGRHAVL